MKIKIIISIEFILWFVFSIVAMRNNGVYAILISVIPTLLLCFQYHISKQDRLIYVPFVFVTLCLCVTGYIAYVSFKPEPDGLALGLLVLMEFCIVGVAWIVWAAFKSNLSKEVKEVD